MFNCKLYRWHSNVVRPDHIIRGTSNHLQYDLEKELLRICLHILYQIIYLHSLIFIMTKNIEKLHCLDIFGTEFLSFATTDSLAWFNGNWNLKTSGGSHVPSSDLIIHSNGIIFLGKAEPMWEENLFMNMDWIIDRVVALIWSQLCTIKCRWSPNHIPLSPSSPTMSRLTI